MAGGGEEGRDRDGGVKWEEVWSERESADGGRERQIEESGEEQSIKPWTF